MSDEKLPRMIRPHSPRARLIGYALGQGAVFLVGCAVVAYFVASSFAATWAQPCTQHETAWCLETVENAVVVGLSPAIRGDGEEISVSSPAFSSTIDISPAPYPEPSKGDHVTLTVFNGTAMSFTDHGITLYPSDAPGWNLGSVLGTVAGLVLEAIAVNVFLAVFRQYRIDRKFA